MSKNLYDLGLMRVLFSTKANINQNNSKLYCIKTKHLLRSYLRKWENKPQKWVFIEQILIKELYRRSKGHLFNKVVIILLIQF